MAVERTVLVVSPTTSVARAIAASARRNGYNALVVKTFAEAKTHLALQPHLVVTELKLGEYNGLHVALRAATRDIPSIVIADSSFEQEVEQVGATWIAATAVAGEGLQAAMLRLLQGAGASRTVFGWFEGDGTTATSLTDWHPPAPDVLH